MNSDLAASIFLIVSVGTWIGVMHLNDVRSYRTWKRFLWEVSMRVLHPRITKAHEEALREDFNRQHLALMSLEDLYLFGSPEQKAAWVAPSWLTNDVAPSAR